MKKFGWLGIGLLLISNTAVLSHVYLNRHGDLQGQMQLTERELPLPYSFRRENSGIALRLDWRMRYREQDDAESYYREPVFPLSETQVQALGLAVEPDRERYYRAGSRQGYVVLEFDGKSHRHALAIERQRLESARREVEAHPGQQDHQRKLEQQERNYQQLQNGSRLYVVDVGLSREALLGQYPGPEHHLVLSAVVRPVFRRQRGGWQLRLERLRVPSVYVPLPYRKVLVDLQGRRSTGQPPRYAAEIHWGSRGEPWLAGLHLLKSR